MRRTAPALAAAALLAACTVEVDGAPCSAPGTASECPGGQACGNDRRCSARALACAASRCTPVADDVCVDARGLASGVDGARTCTDRDPVCGAWVVDPCAARGYVCGTRSGAVRCECAEPSTRELWVDPDGAPTDALPFATGAAAAGCAYRTLTLALSRARDFPYEPASAVTVTAIGAAAGTTVTFSGARGERFPVVVPPGVVLASDAGTPGGRYEILFDAASATSAVVELEAGSTLDGFTVRNEVGEVSTTAIYAACAAADAPVTVSRVAVEARSGSGRRLGVGLSISGACPIRADAIQVRGASGAGIDVAYAPISMIGSRVEGNLGRGLFVSSTSAEIRDSAFVANGDTGVALRDMKGPLSVVGNTIRGNAATTRWYGTYWIPPASRPSGGLVLFGFPPQGGYEIWGNSIYANRGDQVLVVASGTARWVLDRPACADPGAITANRIGCYDPTPADPVSYRGIVAADATVSALNQWWGPSAPTDEDVAVVSPSGTVGLTLDFSTNCIWGPALDCSEMPSP